MNKELLIRVVTDARGCPFYRITRLSPSSYRVWFGVDRQFVISPQLPLDHPHIITWKAWPPKDKRLARHYQHNHIRPLIKSWKGALVLHASSVANQLGCFGFFGKSGVGKSTVAAHFSQKSSLESWGDDWLELIQTNSGFISMRNPSCTRLKPSHAIQLEKADLFTTIGKRPSATSDKFEYVPKQGKISEKLKPLSALFFLNPTGEVESPSLQRMAPAHAFSSLCQHLFRLDTKNPAHLYREFHQLSELTQTVPVFNLSYPHSLKQLSSLRNLLEQHLDFS
ncbi:hypothetical protein N8703_01555 [Verrucomicrobia bacterium]|nr:hypothetical protein [Verrucomicrobiota bacterium]